MYFTWPDCRAANPIQVVVGNGGRLFDVVVPAVLGGSVAGWLVIRSLLNRLRHKLQRKHV